MDHARILELNEDTFDETIKSSPLPILVEFSADWCRPCRLLEPTLKSLADQFAGKFWLAKVDVGDSGDLANRFGIRNVPTLVVFNRGKMVDQIVGAAPEEQLRALLLKQIREA